MKAIKHKLIVLAIPMIVLSALATQCFGSTFGTDASNSIAPFLAAGELSIFASGKDGKQEAIQGAKAIAATGIATEFLKRIVREKRPNSNDLTSFPSGHTSTAFAMATVIADFKPKYKWPAYGIASTIAWSRVDVGAHRWRDVAAGALLGHFLAKGFTNKHVVIGPSGVSYEWKW